MRPAGPLGIEAVAAVYPSREQGWDSAIAPRQKRRTPRIWQMALVATGRLLEQTETQPKSIVVATAFGALDETCAFLEGVYRTGLGSPRNFIASVHNSMAGRLAIELGVAGPNLTLCDGQNSFASALTSIDILTDSDFPVLLLSIDENTELLRTRIAPQVSSLCKPYMAQDGDEGAVALLLTRNQAPSRRSMRAIGPVPLSKGDTPDTACERLARQHFDQPYRLFGLHESSSWVMRPGQLVEELLGKHDSGRFVVGSYSPTAHTIALVELCV